MTGQIELLIEMIIVGILWALSAIFSVSYYVRSLGDRSLNTARTIILSCGIALSILATIFEIAWFCMLLGFSV